MSRRASCYDLSTQLSLQEVCFLSLHTKLSLHPCWTFSLGCMEANLNPMISGQVPRFIYVHCVLYFRRDFGEESELGWNDIWYRVLPVETQKKDKGKQRYQLCLTAVLMMLVSLPLLMMLKFISHISTLFWVLLGIRLVSVYRSSLSVSATWICHHVFIILNDLGKGFQP